MDSRLWPDIGVMTCSFFVNEQMVGLQLKMTVGLFFVNLLLWLHHVINQLYAFLGWYASKNEWRHSGQFWCSDKQKLKTYRCTVIYDIQTCFIPLGHITSIDQQPTCPSHLSLDSLLVSPHQCPVSQSKGSESKGATYQVDYQGVLLWLIKMECAHNEGC